MTPEQALAAAGVQEEQPQPDRKRPAQRSARPRARPLALIDPRQWTGTPPARRWIVRDWIPAGTVTGMYGDGGVGKTLATQQLLTCVALGVPWLGLETTPGRALLVACEDDPDELQRRQHAINAAMGASPGDLADLRLLSRVGEANTLMAFDGRDAEGVLTLFFEELDAAVSRFRPSLLALDTAADLFGGDENIRPQVRRFIGACLGKLARDHDCGVLLLAHPSLSGLNSGTGTGGSTAWNNTLRSRMYLARPTDAPPDVRVLSRRKANYAAAGEELRIEWRDGAFQLATAQAPSAVTWGAITELFDEIERAWNAGRPWSHRPETRRDGRYLPSWAAQQLGTAEKAVAHLLGEWLQGGFLASEIADSKTKAKGLRVLRRPSP